MDNFNEKFAAALQAIGCQVLGEDGTPMSENELKDFCDSHTIYKVGKKWYTRAALFPYGCMDREYQMAYKGESMVVEELTYYGLNDCIVCGLAVAENDGKFGLFPLEERTGTQTGIWSCVGYPFIYDDVKVYADWDRWDDYGYAAVKQNGKWGVIKITQFPESSTAKVAEIKYSTPQEAMKAAGEDELPEENAYPAL